MSDDSAPYRWSGIKYGLMRDILRKHRGEWDYDISYDGPVRCECGWESDEFEHEDHVVATLVHYEKEIFGV